MSHEPDARATSSAAGLPLGADDQIHDTAASIPRQPRSGDDARRRAGAPALRRKLSLISDLLHSLDLVIAAELCTLYYLDCSFFFLIIRGLTQVFFMSPKSDEFVNLMPAHRPHVYAIFLPNIICFLFHAFGSLSQGSEAARGYLHGGVIVDFIGQKAPESRFSLLGLDILVLGLQCIMLTVHFEASKLRKTLQPGNSSNDTNATTSTAAAPTLEDLDAEERGVARPGVQTGTDPGNIELEPLSSTGQLPEDFQDGDSESPGDSSQQAAATGLADVLWSGDAVIADLHVIHTVRTMRSEQRIQSAAATSIQTLGYAATIARMATENRVAREAQRGRPLGP